jgi:hypothetical protein
VHFWERSIYCHTISIYYIFINKNNKMKQIINEAKRLQKLAGILTEAETSFNQWLSDISSGRSYIKQDLDKLGVDVNIVTPEEFMDAVRSSGKLVNQDLEAYKFGNATTVYPKFISFNSGLETFGTYSLMTGKGNITPKSQDPRANIYPQGSKMD